MSIVERDGFLSEDEPSALRWRNHQWDTAQDRREHVYRMAAERTEDLEQRIVQSPGGIDFLMRLRSI